eukprot:3403047-Rhodomonas_salina.1
MERRSMTEARPPVGLRSGCGLAWVGLGCGGGWVWWGLVWGLGVLLWALKFRLLYTQMRINTCDHPRCVSVRSWTDCRW